MPKLKIEIDCNSAAFDYDKITGVEGNELSRILFKLSDTFMHERIIKGNGKLRDSNGNTTGKWELR